MNWRSYAINFVLVYSPNTFRGAPFSELVSTALPPADGPAKEIALLRAAAREFPTVVSVRVHEALETIEGLVAKLALAIRAATGVALATSVLVLAGALAANRRARLADATILKILGATRNRLALMFLIEYAILGAATAAFAVGAGDADRMAGGDPHHVRRFRLRLDLGPRRGRRRPRLHGRPRHGRRLADPRPEAGGVLARIVIGNADSAPAIVDAVADRVGLL